MAWMRRGAMVLVLAGPLLQEGRRDLVQQATATMRRMSAGDPGVDSLILVFGGGHGQGVGGQQITHVPK